MLLSLAMVMAVGALAAMAAIVAMVAVVKMRAPGDIQQRQYIHIWIADGK